MTRDEIFLSDPPELEMDDLMSGNDHDAVLRRFIRDRFGLQPAHPILAEHQRTALTRTVDMIRRRGGAILADEPGMGKSFVAAATAAVFRSEGHAIELIVPAMLRAQWAETLRRFGLDGISVLSHEALHREKREVRPPRTQLIIVDEAHRFRNSKTKRFRALSERAIGQPVLLVTATPVCNRLGDLLTLLRIFAADDILRREGIPSLNRIFIEVDHQGLQRMIEELVIRRTRESLPELLAFAGVDRRVVPFEIARSAEISEKIDQLRFPLIVAPSDRSLLRMFLWKRLESSVAAIRESLVRQRRFYRRALEAGSDGCRLTKREFLRIFGDRGEEAPFQDLMFRSFWFQSGDSSDDDAAEIAQELEAIGRVLESLDGADRSKLQALIDVCAENENRKLLIFTSAIASAKLLYENLRFQRRVAFVSSREAMAGGERCASPGYVFHQFARGRLDVLVSTDLASEGLNLQAAEMVIHYDLPWNPVKLDQRNGRAARIGQKAKSVRAFYFVPSDRMIRRHSLGTISSKERIVRSLFGRSFGASRSESIRGQAFLESLMRTWIENPDQRWSSIFSRNGDPSPFVRLREITGEAVVERIGVVKDDRLSFAWETIGRVFTAGERCGDAVGPAIEDYRRRLENRLLLPGRIVAGPRVTLRRRLEQCGAWSGRWAELLSESYPEGLESAIREAADDRTSEGAEDLEPLLSANWTAPPSFVRVQNIPI